MNKDQLIELSKKDTLDARIKLCKEKAAVGDSVLFYKQDHVLKRGKIVKLTTTGAYVYNPEYRKDGDFDCAGPDGAEWFPFQNKVEGKLGGMVLI